MLDVVVASLEVVIEVRSHFEKAAEFDVVMAQQVIQPAFADEDDPRIQRDRLRLQCGGADKAQGLARRLDTHLPGKQGLLERLPDEWPAQHTARIQNEVAAGCLQQCAAAHQAEVRHQCPHFRLVLDAPDDVRIAGVGLVNDRRLVGICVVDDKVYFILAVELHGIRAEERHRRGLRLLEVLRVPDDVVLDFVKVGGDSRHRLVLLLQVGELHADRVFGNLLVKRFHLFAVRLAEFRHHLDALLQLIAEVFDRGFDFLALILGQLVEFLVTNHLTVDDRCQYVAGGRLQDTDALFCRSLV